MVDRKFLTRAAVAMFVGLAVGAMPTWATAKTGVVQIAKISLRQARSIALKAYPGKIMKGRART
jgi:hypothetical protein